MMCIPNSRYKAYEWLVSITTTASNLIPLDEAFVGVPVVDATSYIMLM